MLLVMQRKASVWRSYAVYADCQRRSSCPVMPSRAYVSVQTASLRTSVGSHIRTTSACLCQALLGDSDVCFKPFYPAGAQFDKNKAEAGEKVSIPCLGFVTVGSRCSQKLPSSDAGCTCQSSAIGVSRPPAVQIGKDREHAENLATKEEKKGIEKHEKGAAGDKLGEAWENVKGA